MKRFAGAAFFAAVVLVLAGCQGQQNGVTFKYVPLVVDARESPDMKAAINIVNEEGQYSMTKKADGSFEAEVSVTADYCVFFLFVDDKAVGNMKNYDGQFEPAADYYVDDGFGGLNALTLIRKSEAMHRIDFVYKVSDDDWQYCEDDNMKVEVRVGQEIYPMDYDENAGVFKKTVEVRGNSVEYYFNVCDQPIADMRTRNDNVQPVPQYYCTDGFGGFNALVVY